MHSEKLRDAIREKEMVGVEANDLWRIPYLDKLLGQRQELVYLGLEEEENRVEELINRLYAFLFITMYQCLCTTINDNNIC